MEIIIGRNMVFICPLMMLSRKSILLMGRKSVIVISVGGKEGMK